MRRLRSLAPDIFIIVLLFLLPLGFFFQQTLGGRSLVPSENLFQYEPYATYAEVVQAPTTPHNDVVSDLILENYQWKSFVREQIALGEVPLWNPHQFAGIPFLAAGQHSALYPLSIIYYIMPLWLAYGWFTVANLWLAGVFMFAFARGLGIGRAGALLAGIIYQFCGFVIASVVFQMMIGALPWLPLMLLMAEYIIREKALFGRKTAIPWVTIGAVALALNILAGHVEVTLYSLLITGFYSGIRWLHDGMGRGGKPAMIRKAAWLIAMVALGFGLGAVQFIPLYDFVQTNWRAERSSYDTVAGYAHVPRDILQFILPNFYGSPAHHSYFDVFSGETVQLPRHTDWGIKNYVEAALYLGILPLLLAVYAIVDRLMWTMEQGSHKLMQSFMSEPPYRMIFSTMALLSLSFMFGLPTYRLIYALPGFNQLNSPFRWIFALSVVIAVLAAFGLDALQRRAAEKVTRGEIRTGLVIMGAGLLVLLGLAASYFTYPQLEGTIEQSIRSLTNAEKAFCIVENDELICNPRAFFSYQFVNASIFGLMLFLSGLVFYWVGRMRMYQGLGLWSAFAIVLVTADLMIASWGFNPASNPLLLDFTPPAIEWMSQQEGDFRYTTLEPPNTRSIINANSTWQYGLDDIRGYDSIIPAPYVDYMRDVAPQVQLDYNRIAPIFTFEGYYENYHHSDYSQALASPLLSLLNVRYIVTYPEVAIPFQDWEAVYGDYAVTIWENPNAMPRAYLLPEMPEAWLAEGRPAPNEITLPTDYQALSYSRDTGRERFLDVVIPEGETAWLIISENYAEGWKAFTRPIGTGEDAESPLAVVPVLGIFQAVQIPAGEQTIRLVYSPQSFQIGFFGSAISAVSLTLLMGMWLWTIFVGTNTADSSQSARVARNSIAPIVLNLFNRSIDFIFAIVLYRLLTQEMVGVYNFAVIVFVWFDIFSNFGLDLFLIRELSREKERSGFYLFNSSFLRFFLSIVGLGLLGLFLLFWQSSVENPLPPDGLWALFLLYLGLFPASLSKGMTSLYYAHEQAEKPAAIATITTINKAIFGVIVLALGWGIIGIAGVSIVNNFITLGVLVWAGRGFISKFVPKPDFALMRGMVKESYPLLLNHFLATIFFQVDVIILQAFKGEVLQAEYSTSYKWLLAINIVPSFFTQALFPVMSRQARENRAALKKTYAFGLKLMLALALPIAVGFTVLAEALTLILAGPSYLPNAAIALTLMIWSIPFGWLNSLTQYALIAVDLQRYITRAFFVAVSFNLIGNLIFIPTYSFYAAAITTILSELVLLIPFAILMQRGLGEKLNWLGIIWRPIVATAAMGGLIYLLLPVNMLIALMVGSFAYLLLLLLLKPFDSEEIAMLPEKLRKLPFFT